MNFNPEKYKKSKGNNEFYPEKYRKSNGNNEF